MATRNVSVPDRMRDWVQSRIDSGQYASVSDYIRDLIRRDQGGKTTRRLWLGWIRLSMPGWQTLPQGGSDLPKKSLIVWKQNMRRWPLMVQNLE